MDSRAAPTLTSNAALVHASSLELLAELGVGDELVAAGRVIRRIVMVDRGRPLARVELADLPTRYAFALGVPQSTTEELLLRRLGELGGSVRRLHRVRSVKVDGGDQVVAGVDESAGDPVPFEIRARYVIGADGSHSAVRSAIGLEFRGETYDSQFVLADVELEYPGSVDDEATIIMSSHGVTVIARLPSGNHRDDRHHGRGCGGSRSPGPGVRRRAPARSWGGRAVGVRAGVGIPVPGPPQGRRPVPRRRGLPRG